MAPADLAHAGLGAAVDVDRLGVGAGGWRTISPSSSSDGGSSFITASAVVVLPQPDSPAEPERLARRERQVDAVDERAIAGG